MGHSDRNRLSGCGLSLLWFLILIFFYTLVGAIFSVKTVLDQGFPLWLVIGRLVVLSGLFVSTFGLLTQRKWGFGAFLGSAAAMVPFSVAYSFYSAQQIENFELTTDWIISNTFVTAIVIVALVATVFYVVRPQDT